MARRGKGLVLRGKTWWLDFTFRGIRHQNRFGKTINKTVAGELAAVERSKVLRHGNRFAQASGWLVAGQRSWAPLLILCDIPLQAD